MWLTWRLDSWLYASLLPGGLAGQISQPAICWDTAVSDMIFVDNFSPADFNLFRKIAGKTRKIGKLANEQFVGSPNWGHRIMGWSIERLMVLIIKRRKRRWKKAVVGGLLGAFSTKETSSTSGKTAAGWGRMLHMKTQRRRNIWYVWHWNVKIPELKFQAIILIPNDQLQKSEFKFQINS